MNHEDFRLVAGADPLHLSDEAVRHMDDCADCRAYHQEMLALEAQLGPALRIPVPPPPPLPSAAASAAGRAGTRRPRFWQYGIAASVAVAAAVAGLLFFGSQETLAHAVAMHADGEPESFLASAPVDPAAIARVMATTGVQLLPGGPMITYARNCPLRGHTVAHLVVQTAQGPVVVLVMTHETVSERRAFSEHGYRGVLVPTGHGSLAVLGAGDHDVDTVVAAVNDRIRYLQ